MSRTSKHQRLDGTVQLCRSFMERDSGSWSHRAAFETSRELIVRGVRVRVICALHVVPGSGRDVPFQSSVTIWPGSHRKRADWKKGGCTSRLRAVGWYEACQRELERYGYDGAWQASPWGRFADFWKMLKGADSAAAEVALLEEIQRQPWATWRTPPSERGAGPRAGSAVTWLKDMPRRGPRGRHN